MTVDRKWLVAGIFLLLLAGCSTKAPSTPSATVSHSSSPTVTSTTMLPSPPNFTVAKSTAIVFDQCSAFEASYNLALAPVMPPPLHTPSGWAPGPSDTGAIGVDGWDCRRVSVGPFERPARVVLEVNAHANIPRSCRQNETGFADVEVLNTLFVSDAAIASYLSETYGVPAIFANITVATQQQPNLTVHTWTWGPSGLTPSTLSILDDGNYQSDTANSLEFFWPKGTGLVALRAEWTDTRPMTGDRAAQGTLNPPMQAATIAQGNFAGFADWLPTYHVDGAFTAYSDTQCKHSL